MSSDSVWCCHNIDQDENDYQIDVGTSAGMTEYVFS